MLFASAAIVGAIPSFVSPSPYKITVYVSTCHNKDCFVTYSYWLHSTHILYMIGCSTDWFQGPSSSFEKRLIVGWDSKSEKRKLKLPICKGNNWVGQAMRGPNNNNERTRDLNNIYYHNDPTLPVMYPWF